MRIYFLINDKNKIPLLGLFFSLTVIFATPGITQAGQANFTWDSNSPKEQVTGYKLYFGETASCESSTVGSLQGVSSTGGASPVNIPVSSLVDSHNPNYNLDGLNEGRWCFRLSAYNVLGESELSSPASIIIDYTAPLISITGPTGDLTYSTTDSRISVSGTASDNVCLGSVTWENNRGGSGTASGTASWVQDGIALQIGDNVITFKAHDCTGFISSASLTVVYIPPYKGTFNPITIHTTPNTYFNANSVPPRINVDFYDADGLSSAWYKVGNTGNWMPIFSGIATHYYSADFTVTGCSEGSNVIYFKVLDSLGNIYESAGNTDTLTILLDTTPPTGTINIE